MCDTGVFHSDDSASTRDPERRSTNGTRQTRVLCIDYAVGFGGASKALSLLTERMRNVQCCIFSSQADEVQRSLYPGRTVFSFRRWFNYRTYRPFKSLAPKSASGRLGQNIVEKLLALFDLIITAIQTIRLIWILRRYSIDVVYMVNGAVPTEGLLASRITDLPCVVHFRGFAEESGTWLERKTIAWADVLVGDSRAVTNSIRRNIPCISDDAIVTTVYEPVDVAAIQSEREERQAARKELGLTNRAVAVGMFGRVVEWKGQREFVEAAVRAMDEDPTIRAVIVGDESDGPPAYLRSVKRLAHNSRHSDKFLFAGYRDDVERLYHAMDIVVHASIRPEPCGMVVLEAMAAGKPVIASRAGGPRELIREGKDGLLAEPGDIDELARSICSLATDPDRRQQLGRSGLRRVRRKFSATVIARELEEILWTAAN